MSSAGLQPFHELWASIRRIIGTPLTMLGHNKRFHIKDQSTESVAVALVDGREAPRRIPREEFERAWQQLKSLGHLAHGDLADKVGNRHATFIASILAETPGIGHRLDPVELYVDSEANQDRTHPLQVGSEKPSSPRESTRATRTRDTGRATRERPTRRAHRVDKGHAVAVERWLTASGWRCQIRTAPSEGWDIEARDASGRRWVISVHDPGASGEEGFLKALEVVLRRMDDPAASYSLALPDRHSYRDGWASLPALVKRRLALTVFLVSDRGEVTYFDV